MVYVHGLWLGGRESVLLRQRLAHALGARALYFRYPSVTATAMDNAVALRRYLTMIRADTLHLVAHSLGGLLILKMFDEMESDGGCELPPGRIVLLGSPVRGSRSARRLLRLPFGRNLLGLTAHEALVPTREPCWSHPRDLGVIAGDLALGAGRLLGPMREPNDGTVLVRETELPGAVERLRVRVSHSGMPFSAAVARQAAAFLRQGHFER